MKLTAVAILLKKDEDADPILFGLAADLSNFGFFQRGSVKEVLVFVARTIAKRYFIPRMLKLTWASSFAIQSLCQSKRVASVNGGD